MPSVGFLPMGGRRRAVVAIFVVLIAVDGVAILSSLAELDLLDRVAAGEPVSDAQLDGNDTRQAAVGGVQALCLPAATIVFIRWLRQAYRNVDVLSPGLRRYGHGWAIGAWFVPILNLWRPKQIVNDVWRAGDRTGSPYGGDGRLPLLLNVWWAGWIVSSLVDQATFRLGLEQETLEELRSLDRVYIVSDALDALDAVVAVIAVLVVRRLTARLEDKGAATAPAGGPEPAPSRWSPTAPERPQPPEWPECPRPPDWPERPEPVG